MSLPDRLPFFRRCGLVCVLALLLAACNDGGSGSFHPDLSGPLVRVHAWVDRPDLEPIPALMLTGLRQVYGVSFTVDPQAIYEQYIATLQAGGQVQAADVLTLFRRIYDGTQVFNATSWSYAGSIDQLTLDALYCDTVPVPADYENQLMTLSTQGGYSTTHALLAALVLRSNGCVPLTAPDMDLLYSRTLAVIDLNDGYLDDVDIEAMTMLAAGGKLAMVPVSVRQTLLDSQQADGSWAEHSPLAGGTVATGYQHATILAYQFLLAWQMNGTFLPLCPRAP